jgi:hypothetical protein
LSETVIVRTIAVLCPSALTCSEAMNYASQFFSIAFGDYMTSCLALFAILVETFLTLQRLFLIGNKRILQNVKLWQVISFFALISAV